LEDWLTHGKKFKLQLIFLHNNMISDDNSRYADQLLTLQSEYGVDHIRKAVDALYKDIDKGFAHWAARFPVKREENNRNTLLAQNNWIHRTEVTSTPTIFFKREAYPLQLQHRGNKVPVLNTSGLRSP
jgi:hypothetical protein